MSPLYGLSHPWQLRLYKMSNKFVNTLSTKHLKLSEWTWQNEYFYPRLVLAFGIVIACICVYVCVCTYICVYVNLWPVQARITKFGQKVQNTLVIVPIVLRGNWLWPSRSNLTLTSNNKRFGIQVPMRSIHQQSRPSCANKHYGYHQFTPSWTGELYIWNIYVHNLHCLWQDYAV